MNWEGLTVRGLGVGGWLLFSNTHGPSLCNLRCFPFELGASRGRAFTWVSGTQKTSVYYWNWIALSLLTFLLSFRRHSGLFRKKKRGRNQPDFWSRGGGESKVEKAWQREWSWGHNMARAGAIIQPGSAVISSGRYVLKSESLLRPDVDWMFQVLRPMKA